MIGNREEAATKAEQGQRRKWLPLLGWTGKGRVKRGQRHLYEARTKRTKREGNPDTPEL